MSYKQWKLYEASKGVYIGMKLSKESVDKILKFISENNIPNGLSREDFHTTIIYSKKTDNVELNEVESVEGTFERFSKFGEDKNVLVMEVKCESLSDLHDYYMNKYDLSWDWNEYKPHVTLSYDAADVDEKSLIWPEDETYIVFCDQYQKDLDPEWSK